MPGYNNNNKGPFYSGIGKKHSHGANKGEWTRPESATGADRRTSGKRTSSEDEYEHERPTNNPARTAPNRPNRAPNQGYARPQNSSSQAPNRPNRAPNQGYARPQNSSSQAPDRPNRAPGFDRKPKPQYPFKPATGTRDPNATASRPVYQDAFDDAAHSEAPAFAPAAPAPAFNRPAARPARPYAGRYDAPTADIDETPENLLVGRNPIREAIKAGRDIEKLLVARGDLSGSAREIIAKAREARIVIQEVDRARLDAIYPNHQGMLAYASAAQYSTLEELLEFAEQSGEPPFFIILDGITDPHNLGAVIRTAECVGAHGVILAQRRSVGLTPAAVKAAAGATEYIKIVRVVNISRTIEELKRHNIWVMGASMEGQLVTKTDMSGAMALVIGAEGEGISQLVKQNCDLLVRLPIRGNIQSLNASVAAGVLMYAVRNARDK